MPRDVPTLSLVLVVHREQAYVEPFVRSVLDQAAGDVEIVAIDDASPDHAPALLDDLATRDPRLRVIHLPQRAGVDAARSRALEEITGDYVWFANTTDLLAPGALAVVTERLRTIAPDVLLVGHAHTDAVGVERPAATNRLLARVAERAPCTFADEPAIAGLAAHAWDKVLVRTLGVAAAGELAVTWRALLAAERIDAVPGVCYVRREPRNAVRDRWVRPAPPALLAQYDAVFAFIDARADTLGSCRGLVAGALLRHALTLLRGLPAAERRAFFGAVAERYRRHGTPEGRTARLVAGDHYGAFEAVERARASRRRLGRRRAALARRRRRLAGAARNRRMQRYYRARLREPIDRDLAVFAAYWYRGYACNPRAVYERARELVPGLRAVWVVKRDAAADLPPGVEHVIAGTREYYDLIARAGWFVNNVNFPNHLVKREGSVHVMTHHGTPLKRMGLDERLSPVSKMDFPALLRRCARWDYSVSANVFSTLIWERVYPLPYASLETGYPRNDVLVRATDEDVRRIRSRLGIAPDQVAVLYAPTHREYQPGFAPVLDLATVADGLGSGHVVLARAHYFYGGDPLLQRLHDQGRILDVSAHPSVEELCLAADALVTDYSSIMFDYAVLDRPIVVHAPDWEVYRAIRGTYFDIVAEAPGVVSRTEAELIDAFRSGAVSGPEATAARAAFRARFCALEDGHAAERVVQSVWGSAIQ